MELTDRQKEILTMLVREYILQAEPVSSELLKKRIGLDISPATIRNDLKELMDSGYINQPHTSAGRVPTQKAYRYFITVTFTPERVQLPDFISREINEARQKIKEELHLAEDLAAQLRHTLALLNEAHHKAHRDSIFEILDIIIHYGHGKPRK